MQKILVIDDDDFLRGLVHGALQRKGIAAWESDTGEQGVQLARQHLPDLILCDVNLAAGDAHTALASLRQQPATARIPVIWMTGQPARMASRTESAAADFLVKPFTVEALYQAVATVLGPLALSVRSDDKTLLDQRGAPGISALPDAGTSNDDAPVSPPLPDEPAADDPRAASPKQLRAVSARLLAVLEAEKTRIARAIHDDFAQKLTALAIELALLDGTLKEPGDALPSKSVRQKINTLRGLVEDMIKSARKIESQLRPKVLDEFGLTAALEWQSQTFGQDTGIQCEFSAVPEDITLDSSVSTEIFRLFQEILSNVSRHARASRLDIHVTAQAGRLRLEVQDNGRGITEQQIHATESIGLVGLRERAALLGGQLHVEGIPGTGTTVILEVPIKYR